MLPTRVKRRVFSDNGELEFIGNEICRMLSQANNVLHENSDYICREKPNAGNLRGSPLLTGAESQAQNKKGTDLNSAFYKTATFRRES